MTRTMTILVISLCTLALNSPAGNPGVAQTNTIQDVCVRLKVRYDALRIHLDAIEHATFFVERRYIAELVQGDREPETIARLRKGGDVCFTPFPAKPSAYKAVCDALRRRTVEVQAAMMIIEAELPQLTNCSAQVAIEVQALTAETERRLPDLIQKPGAANQVPEDIGTNAPNLQH